jgi:hypothetical protein
MSTARASFRGWIPAVNEMDKLVFAFGYPLQNIAELREGNVADLTSPKLFHRFDIQGFQNNDIKPVGQVMGKFIEPIAAMMGNSLVHTIEFVLGLMPVRRSFDFTGQFTARFANLIQGRLKPFRRLDFFSIRQSEESFQTEVCPNDDVTQSVRDFFYTVNTEVHKQFTQRGTLNRDRLDLSKNFARLTKLINKLADTQLVRAEQLPSGLLERERTILFYLLKRRTTEALANLSCFVVEEKLIAAIYPLANILYSLRSQQSEVGIARALGKLRNVLLHGIDIDILAGQLEISAMQSNAVVPNQTGNVYLLVKRFILFVSVQFEFQRFHALFALTLDSQVDQRWLSCSRLWQHRYVEAFLRCLSRHASFDIPCTYYTSLRT